MKKNYYIISIISSTKIKQLKIKQLKKIINLQHLLMMEKLFHRFHPIKLT